MNDLANTISDLIRIKKRVSQLILNLQRLQASSKKALSEQLDAVCEAGISADPVKK